MNITKLILSLASLAVVTSSASLRAEEPPASYPLTKCVVSDEKLGEHGKPVKVTQDGIDVYLCCKMCKKDFAKNPGKYTKMVTEAAAAKK
ncbi:MAG: hypothetical protein ABIT76_01665 [Chthoniobacterales bacterium]